MRCICTTLLNGLNHPHPNFPQRFFYLHRLALSCETVGQQAFVAWLGEDVGVEYDVVVPFCMTCRAGDAAGVAFAVQACAEDLRGAVITRVDEFGMLRQCRTQVEQRGVAMHTVDFALGEDGFARIAPARVGEQAVDQWYTVSCTVVATLSLPYHTPKLPSEKRDCCQWGRAKG